MRGGGPSSSSNTLRFAPAAVMTAPYVPASPPIEPASTMQYMRYDVSVPAVISPSITSPAPTYRMRPIAQPTTKPMNEPKIPPDTATLTPSV